MKSDNIIKVLLISFSTLVLLSILGYAYAYFSLQIEGTPKDVIVSTGALRLEYKDEAELKLDGAFPGDSVSKVVTVKNVGTENVAYSLYWRELINTIENFELHVTLNCKSYINYGESNQTESGTCDNIYRAVPMSDTVTTDTIKGNISIDPEITHEYTVTITFDDKKYDQSYNKNKTFTGKIGIQEYIVPSVTNCTFDGELTPGAEYVNGQYTYRYNQKGVFSSTNDLAWSDISDGWGVQLTDKSSTDPVTSKVCTYINDKPVISMSHMFSKSQATTLDLSSFDTSNVRDMSGMFRSSKAITLNLSSFNTAKVTDMSLMFAYSAASSLDLSSFNTANVTDMSLMFAYNAASSLDLSSFDTSNVTDMSRMFESSKATTLNLSSFNTSKVNNMSRMFVYNAASSLDLSSFDTSNVTDMSHMFESSKATTLDLSSFDTSKVTDMGNMFYYSKATTLDVSNFDTSNVTNMSNMFSNSKATTLNLSSFNTSKVNNMSRMFEASNATTLDLSSFDTSNVTNMSYMFSHSFKIKTIYVSNNFITDNVTSSTNMFNGVTNLVGGNGTVYNSSYNDKTYARIDKTGTPGYFTSK